MSWIKSGSIAVALCALALPGMAAAGIVVASSGPSARQYPVGKKIDDGAAITLQTGDSVTVLDQRGTRVLRGPGTMALGKGASPATSSVFAALTRQRSTARVRTGAVRNGPGSGPVRSPNLWYVDLAASGPVCVVELGTSFTAALVVDERGEWIELSVSGTMAKIYGSRLLVIRPHSGNAISVRSERSNERAD